MIQQDQLALFLDDALDAGPRAVLETELERDAEALRFVIEQRKMDRLLRSVLASTHRQRLKESILAAVSGRSPEQLQAGVLADTSNRGGKPATADSLTASWWQRIRLWIDALLPHVGSPRRSRFAFASAVVLLAVGAWLFFRPAPIVRVEVGEFATVVGEPVLQHEANALPLVPRPSTPIHLGDRLETGDADKAEIAFKDGTTLRLGFNTIVEIPEPNAAHTKPNQTLLRPPEINLVLGQVWTKVQKLTNAPQYAIRTEAATAIARGTEFGVKLQRARTLVSQPSSSLGSPTATLTVKEGVVDFTNFLGSVQATAMTESTASADARPTEPKRLQSLQVLLGDTIKWSILTSPLDWPEAAQRLVPGGGWAGLNVRDFPVNTAAGNPGGPTNEVRVILVGGQSPASSVGLRIGDVMTLVEGQDLLEASQFSRMVLMHPDTDLAVSFRRDGETKSLALRPIERTCVVPGPALTAPLVEQVRTFTREWVRRGLDANDLKAPPGAEAAVTGAAENNLGVLLEAGDAMGPAIRAYGRAVRAAAEVPLYRFNLGLALRKIGSFERAAEELGKAVELAPGSVEAGKRLAEVHSLLGDDNGALEQAEAALQSAPRDHGLWELKARILSGQGRAVAATAAARMAVETGPGCHVALGYLGLALHGEGDLAGAEETYRKALALAPYEPVLHVNLGTVLKDRGQLDLTQQCFLRAIELQPDLELAWSNLGGLGTTLAQRGDLAGAERLLRLVCEHNPESSAMNNNLGEALRLQGRMEEAISYFRNAMQLDPNNPGPYNNLGIIHAMRKEFDEAEKLFRGVIARSPTEANAPMYVNLASVLGEQGKLAEAEPMFRKALAVNPNDPAVGNALAFFLADHQLKLDEALSLSRRAVQAVPGNFEFLDTMGWVLFQRGELDEAERTFMKALELVGENPSAKEIREHLKKTEERKAQLGR